jgi:tRNA(fMet)-specific endonuclease VapC
VIFLLDTDTLVALARGLKSTKLAARRQAETLKRRLQQTQNDGDTVSVSAVTVSELEYGARKSRDYDSEIAAVHLVLSPFLILDYERVHCPVHYGEIRSELAAKGTPIGAMDLMIAAHARALDATLVSNNTAHFGRVSGLNVVNWLGGSS